MMPDVDGIELLRHIRSDEAFNSMPVVSESSIFGGAPLWACCAMMSAVMITSTREDLVNYTSFSIKTDHSVCGAE